MRYLKRLLTTGILLASFSVLSQPPKTENAQTVRSFITAFNRHDSDAMSRFVTNDVQWLSVDGDSIVVETDGKAALVTAMNAYFRSCPTCRSRLAKMISSRDRVSAIETASWQGKDGSRTQSGISVYEFSEGLIKRVYYFPSEK
jgi:hypothetical protein